MKPVIDEGNCGEEGDGGDEGPGDYKAKRPQPLPRVQAEEVVAPSANISVKVKMWTLLFWSIHMQWHNRALTVISS